MVNKLINKLVNSGLLAKLVNIQPIAEILIHCTPIHLRIHYTYCSWSQLLNFWLSLMVLGSAIVVGVLSGH